MRFQPPPPFAPSASRWLTVPRPRFGPDPDLGGAGGTAAVDLANPAVQAAIAAASQKAIQAAQSGWEAEKGRILANKDEILGEKRVWDETLGKLGKPADLAARLRRLDELETANKAKEAGVDTPKFEAAVEAAAQIKFKAREQELADRMGKDQAKIAQLETAQKALEAKAHRMFVAREIALAALPPGHKFIQDGAHDYLIDRLAPYLVPEEVDGLTMPVARIKVGGTILSSAEGFMAPTELLNQLRGGKTPIPGLPDVSFCFVSAGEGSKTVQPDGKTLAAPGSWYDMTDEQRDAYVEKHGAQGARDLMAKSPRKDKAA